MSVPQTGPFPRNKISIKSAGNGHQLRPPRLGMETSRDLEIIPSRENVFLAMLCLTKSTLNINI